MFWNIDIKDGLVTYDDISFLSEDFDPREQADNLKEDMLQIEFPKKKLILDVGWRPSFEEDGAFCVTLIKDCDWGKPIAQAQVSDVISVKKTISKFIEHHV